MRALGAAHLARMVKIMSMEMTATDMTLDTAKAPSRNFAGALILAALTVAAIMPPPAEAVPASIAPRSEPQESLRKAIQHDARAAGVFFKEGAHRIAVASKAMGHEIATAAKRGAAETRKAFRHLKSGKPAT